MKKGLITLSQKQLKKFKVINSFIDKAITRQQAAELLNLSPRQISRLKKGVLESGVESLIHKNAGRKPAHAISEKKKELILEIHSLPQFQAVNFLHFKDILADDYKINISYSSISSILKNSGIESPKKKKVRHRTHRRKRKDHPGQLIQIDATPFEWFGSKQKFALHGAIDDATGEIVGLYMTQNECLYGYLETMRQCCLEFGVPQTIYSDNHTIFRSPKTGKLTVEEMIAGKTVNLTQFGRSMHELGVDMIFAKSPQAKGRIERLWDTLQSRLPVEFAMRNITTISAANKFLETEYRVLFNNKFSVPSVGASLYVPLKNNVDIDTILCVKHTRKTDNAGVFSFKNRCFQILDEGYPIISSRKEIQVLISPRFGIRIKYKNKIYKTIRYLKPQRKNAKKTISKKAIQNVKPHLIHSSDEWKKIWWAEDYNLSLKFLYELFFKKQHSTG